MRFIFPAIILILVFPPALRADTIHPQGLWGTYNGPNGPATPLPKPKPKLKR